MATTILRSSNCDNRSGSTWDKWRKYPTKKQLTKTLKDYHDDPEELEKIVEELHRTGDCHVDNGDCTHYELEEL